MKQITIELMIHRFSEILRIGGMLKQELTI